MSSCQLRQLCVLFSAQLPGEAPQGRRVDFSKSFHRTSSKEISRNQGQMVL